MRAGGRSKPAASSKRTAGLLRGRMRERGPQSVAVPPAFPLSAPGETVLSHAQIRERSHAAIKRANPSSPLYCATRRGVFCGNRKLASASNYHLLRLFNCSAYALRFPQGRYFADEKLCNEVMRYWVYVPVPGYEISIECATSAFHSGSWINGVNP